MTAAAWIALPAGASAETLNDALVAAYAQNPQLSAQRARLRATDENVARAHSGYRPRIEGNAFGGYRKYDNTPTFFPDEDVDIKGYQVSVRQPVFRGLRTINSVLQAEELSAAGQNSLKAVESQTLLSAIAAYADVQRDQIVYDLRSQNVGALSGLVNATQARLAAEDATRADVSQAEARRARANADKDFAEANLNASQATYVEVIGHAPQKLTAPGEPFQALLPPTLEAAMALTQSGNPNVEAALHREAAATHAVDTIRGELLPEVSLEGSWTQTFDGEPGTDRLDDGLLVGRVRVPLYEGGEIYSRVRQAKQEHLAAIEDVRTSRASAASGIVAAWTRLKAARAQVKANDQQIRATETALKSVREEEKIGSRTVLDVLNAQQELIDAKVAAAAARREVLVAGFQVLALTGQLTIEQLGFSGAVYDPAAHLNAIRRKWIGTDIAEDERTLIQPFAGEAQEAAYTVDPALAGIADGWSATTVKQAILPLAAPKQPLAAKETSGKDTTRIADAMQKSEPHIAVGRLAIARSSRQIKRSPVIADGHIAMTSKASVKQRGTRPAVKVSPVPPAAEENTTLAFKPSL